MECGGGELSDSGSSGYWSWDHGNVSPAPSPSVTEMDSSPDEGLHMELEQGEELNAKKPKVHISTWSLQNFITIWWKHDLKGSMSRLTLSLFYVLCLSQSSFRGVYKCLWPSCGKVLTSSVGIKRHIRVLHLGWVEKLLIYIDNQLGVDWNVLMLEVTQYLSLIINTKIILFWGWSELKKGSCSSTVSKLLCGEHNKTVYAVYSSPLYWGYIHD